MENIKHYIFYDLDGNATVGYETNNKGYFFDLKDGKEKKYLDIFEDFAGIDEKEFIEDIAKNFQNEFEKNVYVIHNDYEFKISIPKDFIEKEDVNKALVVLDDILENWFSDTLENIENSIHLSYGETVIKFRLHEEREIRMRYYGKVENK